MNALRLAELIHLYRERAVRVAELARLDDAIAAAFADTFEDDAEAEADVQAPANDVPRAAVRRTFTPPPREVPPPARARAKRTLRRIGANK